MVLLLVKAVGPLVLQRQFMEEVRVILSQMGKYLLILALMEFVPSYKIAPQIAVSDHPSL